MINTQQFRPKNLLNMHDNDSETSSRAQRIDRPYKIRGSMQVYENFRRKIVPHFRTPLSPSRTEKREILALTVIV